MKRRRIYWMLVICFILLIILNTLHAAEENKSSNVTEITVKDIHDNKVDDNNLKGKDKFIDKDDYYYLNTGKKKSFLREDNAYFIVRNNKKKQNMQNKALLSVGDLASRFGDSINIIKKHRLGNLIKFSIKEGKKREDVISAIKKADASISLISPALTSVDKGGEIAVTPYIIVSIDASYDLNEVITKLQNNNLLLSDKLSYKDTEWEMRVVEPIEDIGRIFEITRTIAELPFVEWAEPNFIVNMEKLFTPDDTLFNNQWHLNNTGQNGATIDADIDGSEGWNISQGNGSIIAIIDDGVDTSHEDLNIWSNPAETGSGRETNGIDDDGNGYEDDYQGWDFADYDNDPDPSGADDNHGTSVAGVAGAIGNNSRGVVGSALGSMILPVRSGSMSCVNWGNAMRYAGRHADVVNNSWSISACQSELNAAISDVVNGNITGARRGPKGTPVLFASGNNASGWRKYTLNGLWAGSWTFRWQFVKNVSISEGYDTVWLDDISWPGGTVDFESDVVGSIPGGFSSSGSATWTTISDGVHARSAAGKSAKAGTISNNQYTNLETTVTVSAGGALIFWHWVSSEQCCDLLKLYAINTSTTYGPFLNYAPGQYGHQNEVGYPASNPDTIAVGASTDGEPGGIEERSYYSQFGPELDVVAPSSGGGQGIYTTDRMGSYGYSSTNYYSNFSGTSAATPVVSGVVADIVAFSPGLTANQIRTVLHDGADKIGPYAYSGGRNNYYGYGRVNLLNSLNSISADVCGVVSGTWSSGYMYNVTCGIIVNSGESLTIESGAIINNLEDFSFTVNGVLTWNP